MSWVIYHAVAKQRAVKNQQELELASAVASNNTRAVAKLLNRGINPNVRIVGKNKEPLIFLAFEKTRFILPLPKIGDRPQNRYKITAKFECLRLLLKYGANPNLRDSFGRTVLEIAILWCLPETVKLLLLNGANPNLADENGQTPLMKCAILGVRDARPIQHKLEIIIHLIDSGAAIDTQAPDGKTALMYAVGNSRQEIVELLVSSGASLTITDNQGNNAKDILDRSTTIQQKSQLRKILSQPQVNVRRYKYRELIPEGDRILATIIAREKKGDRPAFNDLPRRF